VSRGEIKMNGLGAAGPPTLTTDRLTLRPIAEDDWPAYRAFAADPEAQRWQLAPAYDSAALRAVFCGYLRLCALGEVSAGYAVVSRATGALVGVCMSMPVSGGHSGEAQFGFLIARAYWRRGYATEASRALLGHLFETAGALRVVAGCYAGNPASARVLQKLGMRRLPLRFPAGPLLRLFPGRRGRTELWHVLSAEEWRARQVAAA
jgi:RimJ/RimL family protein N-acetyltransferase